MDNDVVTLFDCLNPLISFLSIPRLRSWLLDTSPVDDIPLLTSPTHTLHALAGTIRHVSLASFLPPSLISAFDADWVIVPAFCYSRYTALFIIKDSPPIPSGTELPICEGALGPFVSSPTLVLHGVRDDESGEITACSLDLTQNHVYTMVMLTSSCQTRRRKCRAFFRLHLPTLRDTCNTPTSLAQLVATVPFFFRCIETPQCVRCVRDCVCPVPPTRCAIHPLDFGTTRANTMRQVGSYTTKANTTVLVGGVVINATRFVMLSGEMRGGCPSGTVSRLINWAVSSSLAKAISKATPSAAPFQRVIDGASDYFDLAQVLDSAISAQGDDVEKHAMVVLGDHSHSDGHSDGKSVHIDDALGVMSATSIPSYNAPNGAPMILPGVRSDEHLSANEIKAFRRKLRNRASAARANLRKQMHMAGLKRSIAEQKLLAERLQERFEDLRRENAALRNQKAAENCSSSSVTNSLHDDTLTTLQPTTSSEPHHHRTDDGGD